MIAVSYSGGTPDVEEAILRFRERNGAHVTLITGAPDARLAPLADALLVHRHTPDGGAEVHRDTERGFISFAATVAPAAAFAGVDGATVASRALARNAASVSIDGHTASFAAAGELLGSAERVEVIGGRWAWPAVLDFESKWTEANLGAAVVHEPKNFPHGRYISVLERSVRPVAVLLGVGVGDDYEQELRRVLAAHCRLVEIRSRFEGALGGLAVLHAVAPLAAIAGEIRGVDISRPHIPADGVSLHSWKWRTP